MYTTLLYAVGRLIPEIVAVCILYNCKNGLFDSDRTL